MKSKHKIAMLGTKGIPAKWGGIEKYVQEISTRLACKGHDVSVYGSRWFLRDIESKVYKGVKIVRVPAIKWQATDALTNGLFSVILLLFKECDVAHFHGYASYFFAPVLRGMGIKTVVTAHGFESGWDNPKYGKYARFVIKKGYETGIKHGSRITSVASHISNRIRADYGVEAEVIASGIDVPQYRGPNMIRKRYGLNGRDYVLFLGRIDPIKRIDWIVDIAVAGSNGVTYVIAGGAQNKETERYYKRLVDHVEKARARVIFTGPVEGDLKYELLSNCRVFVSPSQDEGLPIALLEAMSYGCVCVASDIPAHREVIENKASGYLFRSGDRGHFTETIMKVLHQLDREQLAVGSRARQKVNERYNWDKATERYESIYSELIGIDERRQYQK
jgi:glycosyltransferase involved in cell wall biosynthesis